jgi:hypothetical protein
MKRNGENATGYQENGEVLRRSALRIDARKWLAGKMAPKKYSDKQIHEHGGPDGGPITLEALIRCHVDPLDARRLGHMESATTFAMSNIGFPICDVRDDPRISRVQHTIRTYNAAPTPWSAIASSVSVDSGMHLGVGTSRYRALY